MLHKVQIKMLRLVTVEQAASWDFLHHDFAYSIHHKFQFLRWMNWNASHLLLTLLCMTCRSANTIFQGTHDDATKFRDDGFLGSRTPTMDISLCVYATSALGHVRELPHLKYRMQWARSRHFGSGIHRYDMKEMGTSDRAWHSWAQGIRLFNGSHFLNSNKNRKDEYI